jgi:4-hydroxy-tetrahydrodipicolinate synthase
MVGANTVEEVTALRGRPEVTAALTLVPAFLRPGEQGVVAQFAALAAASPVPLVVYHVPYRTAQRLSTGAVRRLADLAGVIGIKYAIGVIDADTVELLAHPPARFTVLGGDDTLISPLLALGASGGILASAHLATNRFVELVEAWRACDAAAARPLGHRLAAMSSAMFAAPNPTVIKAVLHARGRIPSASVRLPLLPADRRVVRSALRLLDGLRAPLSRDLHAATAQRQPRASATRDDLTQEHAGG